MFSLMVVDWAVDFDRWGDQILETARAEKQELRVNISNNMVNKQQEGAYKPSQVNPSILANWNPLTILWRQNL